MIGVCVGEWIGVSFNGGGHGCAENEKGIGMAYEEEKIRAALDRLPVEQRASAPLGKPWALARADEVCSHSEIHWKSALAAFHMLSPFVPHARRLRAAIHGRWGAVGEELPADECAYWAGLASLVVEEGLGPNGAAKIERFERKGRRMFLGRSEADWSAWRECCATYRRCCRNWGGSEDGVFQWLSTRICWAALPDSEGLCIAVALGLEYPPRAEKSLVFLGSKGFSWTKERFEAFAGKACARSSFMDEWARSQSLMELACSQAASQGLEPPAAEVVAWAWLDGQGGIAQALASAGARVDLLDDALAAMRESSRTPRKEIWEIALSQIEASILARSLGSSGGACVEAFGRSSRL